MDERSAARVTGVRVAVVIVVIAIGIATGSSILTVHRIATLSPERQAEVAVMMEHLNVAVRGDQIVSPSGRFAAVVYRDGVAIMLQACLGCPVQHRTLRRLVERGAQLVPKGAVEKFPRALVIWYSQEPPVSDEPF